MSPDETRREKGFGVSGFARIRDAPMMPAPMKPSLVGVGESAAMVTTERVERTGGREVGVDRLLGVGVSAGCRDAERLCWIKRIEDTTRDCASLRSTRDAAHLWSDFEGARVGTAVCRRHVCANIEEWHSERAGSASCLKT